MSETEHHLEHAEHAQHAAHNPFDRRVTMTIAIIAAMLACVTLLSHRAHNLTLQLEIQANDSYTLASNKWNYFQAKKNRQYMYQAFIENDKAMNEILPKKLDAQLATWQAQVDKYKEDGDKLEKEARQLDEEGKKLKEKSEHIHHITDRYDMAELAVEIGLVLCSIAVLTKRTGFWISAMLCSGLGVTIAVWGLAGQYGSAEEHSGEQEKTAALVRIESPPPRSFL